MLDDQGMEATIATLGTRAAKARFGVAYFRSICSQAGIGFNETSVDEDALAIDGTVEFAAAAARIQVKCTGQFKINGGNTATWPVEPAWRDKWTSSKLPVYFVLLIVDPDDQRCWLDHRLDGTLHRAAAFWVRVDSLSEGQNIVVPKHQRFTAETLRQWATDVEMCFMPTIPEEGHAG
ncbi:DUF4365 domain-containing protein [Actinopolymorpha sp. B11F2]|uniref:DUF4365 domain-containing protein n=1 Tax=Actinopolymorpha sp. B11F2 TaxID=3160862 RepID=UPI0032E4AD5E